MHDLKEQYGIVLRSVTEPIDTASPMGGMIFAILASFAAEERRVITGRTLAGKKEKASRGGFAGGAAPLGYKRDLQGGLLIDDAESAIVRQIVNDACRGMFPSSDRNRTQRRAAVCRNVASSSTRAQSATCLITRNTGAGTSISSGTMVKPTVCPKDRIRLFFPKQHRRGSKT